MKGRMLRKLKKISTSPSWRNPSSLSTIRPSPNENPTMSETSFIVVEQHFADDADEEKSSLTSPVRSREKPLTSPNPVDHGQSCPKLQVPTFQEEIEEKWCPPGGRESIVLYTTSLRGIRKTFEDCNAIRFLLGSFRVVYSERDVSMHMEYRDELWRILGGRVVPPRLFILGRCVGGADEVVGLHETGALRTMLHGIPLSPSSCPCGVCGGQHFVLCATCNGSRKVVAAGGHTNGTRMRCPECNENGLVKCSLCS